MSDKMVMRMQQSSPTSMKLKLGQTAPRGTGDYNYLSGKPSIEGVVLEGDKTFEELNLSPVGTEKIDRWFFGE